MITMIYCANCCLCRMQARALLLFVGTKGRGSWGSCSPFQAVCHEVIVSYSCRWKDSSLHVFNDCKYLWLETSWGEGGGGLCLDCSRPQLMHTSARCGFPWTNQSNVNVYAPAALHVENHLGSAFFLTWAFQRGHLWGCFRVRWLTPPRPLLDDFGVVCGRRLQPLKQHSSRF